jgi:hypothetical protein
VGRAPSREGHDGEAGAAREGASALRDRRDQGEVLERPHAGARRAVPPRRARTRGRIWRPHVELPPGRDAAVLRMGGPNGSRVGGPAPCARQAERGGGSPSRTPRAHGRRAARAPEGDGRRTGARRDERAGARAALPARVGDGTSAVRTAATRRRGPRRRGRRARIRRRPGEEREERAGGSRAAARGDGTHRGRVRGASYATRTGVLGADVVLGSSVPARGPGGRRGGRSRRRRASRGLPRAADDALHEPRAERRRAPGRAEDHAALDADAHEQRLHRAGPRRRTGGRRCASRHGCVPRRGSGGDGDGRPRNDAKRLAGRLAGAHGDRRSSASIGGTRRRDVVRP